MIVVTRLTQSDAATLAGARRLLELLTAAAGCTAGWFGRSVDDPQRLVVVTTWTGPGHYRRAVGSVAAKILLAELGSVLVPEAGAYEVLRTVTRGVGTDHASLLADEGDGPAGGAGYPGPSADR